MTDFAVFAQKIIDEFAKEGRKHTSETRKYSANRLLMFMADKPTPMDKWDELFVQDYETWLKSQGLSASTIAYYLSQLCAFYKQAVKKRKHTRARHFSPGKQDTIAKTCRPTVSLDSRVALFANSQS